MHYRLSLLYIALFVPVPAILNAETSIRSVAPRTCKPGQATQLTLHGSELDQSLRVLTSVSSAKLRILSVEPTTATLEITIPEDTALGPIGLWTFAAAGPLKPLVLMVDDLESIADNGSNHSIESAQVLTTHCAVDGTCDAAMSDFYRISVSQVQRIAFSLHAQPLQSTMDPVLRILDSHGKTVALRDDGVGPDLQCSHVFKEAGDYFIEVSDSRHAAAASAYHLRIGDFPLVRHCYPLAIRSGEKQMVQFVCENDARLPGREVEVPSDSDADALRVTTSLGAGDSTWASVLVRDEVQYTEPASTAAEASQDPPLLSIPVGISGRLAVPTERDTYRLQGTKGQLIRIVSRTRSLGCPTLLRMELRNPQGAKVTESKVSEADEWSFDYTFPDDGAYRLEVVDLLKRGGLGYGYWIGIHPAGSFEIALKADAATSEQFAIEEQRGACAIDLQVSRFGYEGEIQLSLSAAEQGLRLLNPSIPAKAKDARIYLVADANWKSDADRVVHLLARADNSAIFDVRLSSRALHRIKQPHILVQPNWNDGAIAVGGTAKSKTPFTLEPSASVQFARPVKTHAAQLTLKRDNAEFKAGVSLLGDALHQGWELKTAVDKDVYSLTLNQIGQDSAQPEQLELLAYSEFAGHAAIDPIVVPVQWIDPVLIRLEQVGPLVAGGRGVIRASVSRAGNDPQPIVLKLENLPAGLTGPESVTLTVDQTQVDIELGATREVSIDSPLSLSLVALSQYGGNDFSVASNALALRVTAMPARLEAYPPEVVLDGPADRQQLTLTGIDLAGSLRDWTRDASITCDNPEIAEVRGSQVFPKSNGQTSLVFQVGGARSSIPLVVSNFEAEHRVAFESEVLVALSKQGCNSGACHGSPSGKGGFRLSLRAFDKQLDELTLIREDAGRRVNPLEAEQSLILLKPMMKLEHGGGKKLHTDNAAYSILKNWVAQGATQDPADTPRCVQLELFPSQKRILAIGDGGQQVAVTAHFSDGTSRDVTHLVAYETSNSDVAVVDSLGFVQPAGRGEAAVLVRFLEHIESVPLMFVDHDEGFQWSAPPTNNYVDELVNAKLRQLQYLPSETCSDTDFLRRAYLDVIGILPTVEETTQFLAEPKQDKRARVIDQLLERDEYAKFWTLKWGDLLKMTSKLVGDEGVHKYHRWVEESFRNNMPYDQFALQLLTGTGSTYANPPANFYRTATDMNECVETISQVFLGARLQCAKCHNHPFERWTQDNYYGLGAFFQRVERRATQRPGEQFVWTKESGEVTQPRTGQIMQPWLPQVGSISADGDEDRRIAFASWLISPTNPYFARIEANRIWSQLFVRGIVEPVDDFRDSNPPSNATLLDALAQDFAESGFDRKHLLRTILNSRTYQASFQTNASNQADGAYFSHQEPRLLGAEQLLDAINQSLALSQTFGSLPAGTRATQLTAPDLVKVDFLKVFGQPERSSVCACERSDDSNLGMAIELFNGPMMYEKLRDPDNRFHAALAAGRPVEETIRELYLAAVCREPSTAEFTAAIDHCARAENAAAGLEDVCWALFNTDEFLFQH